MGANDSLRQTLEHFLQQKQKKLEELRSLELTIRQIRQELGEEEESGGEDAVVFPPIIERSGEQKAIVSGKELDIRPDDFFGKTHSEAAKAYLEKVGRAVSMKQLVEALNKGGCKVGGAEPQKTLYISLVRNVRDFVPVQPGYDGYIGLRKFYPNLRGKKGKRE